MSALVIGLVILLVLVLVGGGAWYYFTKSSPPPGPSPVEPSEFSDISGWYLDPNYTLIMRFDGVHKSKAGYVLIYRQNSDYEEYSYTRSSETDLVLDDEDSTLFKIKGNKLSIVIDTAYQLVKIPLSDSLKTINGTYQISDQVDIATITFSDGTGTFGQYTLNINNDPVIPMSYLRPAENVLLTIDSNIQVGSIDFATNKINVLDADFIKK